MELSTHLLLNTEKVNRLLPFLQAASKNQGIDENFWQDYLNFLNKIKTNQNQLDPYFYPLLPVRASAYFVGFTFVKIAMLPTVIFFEGKGTVTEFLKKVFVNPTVEEITKIKTNAIEAEQKLAEFSIQLTALIESDKLNWLVQLLAITPAEMLSSLLSTLAEKKSAIYQAFMDIVKDATSLKEKLAYLDAALDKDSALFQIFNCQKTLYGKIGSIFANTTNTINKIQDYKSALVLASDIHEEAVESEKLSSNRLNL